MHKFNLWLLFASLAVLAFAFSVDAKPQRKVQKDDDDDFGEVNLEDDDVQVVEDGPIPKNLRGPSSYGEDSDEDESDSSIADALTSSFAMIIVSEIGDETFIIAAIMAMRQPRVVVLCGALAALYVMTILSTMLGYVVPNLITKEVAHNIATYIYVFFGLRLFYIAYSNKPKDDLEEVEDKLKDTAKNGSKDANGILAVLFNPVFLEAFLLTFSAEWGDRSQIATIALAAHKNPYAVTIGACAGHTICTSIAVWGGRLVASQISQRTVAIAGGITFFVFAAYNMFFATID